MAKESPRDVLEATLKAWKDRDWDSFSDRLIDIKTGENVPETTLRQEFRGIDLVDYSILEIEEVSDFRRDVDVALERDWIGERNTVTNVTMFLVGEDGRPDDNGTWTVTNPIKLRTQGDRSA